LAAVLTSVVSPAARATFHLIEVNEVYSNADGSIQYVELISRGASQTMLGPTRDHALLNTGAALVVAGLAHDLAERADLAAKAIDDGQALAKLEQWRCAAGETGR
jgi:anthranilate phosphoribosyltransferase